MPTERINFDVTQDALLIFINDSHSMKEAEATDQLEQLFHGAKEYLYLDGAAIESGTELAGKIAQERDAYRISVPASNRLVVCFWMDVGQLTDAWFARYQKIAEETRRLLPVQGYGQHCFITCLTYEVGMQACRKDTGSGIAEVCRSGASVFSYAVPSVQANTGKLGPAEGSNGAVASYVDQKRLSEDSGSIGSALYEIDSHCEQCGLSGSGGGTVPEKN